MKFLTLALLLAGFSVCTLQAAEQHAVSAPTEHAQHDQTPPQAAPKPAHTQEEARRLHQKCVKAGGSIKGGDKDGQCWSKKGHMQAYSIRR